MENNLIYHDGHSLYVSEDEVKIKDHQYPIDDITDIKLCKEVKLSQVFIMAGVGVLLMTIALLGVFPKIEIAPYIPIDWNLFVLYAGFLCVIGGALLAIFDHEYTISLITSTGLEKPLAKGDKPAIDKIAHALRRALRYRYGYYLAREREEPFMPLEIGMVREARSSV